MARTVIFGDIHGCLNEFKDLLQKIGPGRDDRIVSVGDLVCKGPYPSQTLDFARRLKNFTAILGNHELRLLRYWNEADRPEDWLEPCDALAAKRMGRNFDDHMRYVASWPHYLDLPEVLVVHGGLRPGVPLTRQDLDDLTDLRRVTPGGRPWYEDWKGSKPVVFGHWVHREPIMTETAIGLDSGCVYGNKLSALVLPERRVVQVRARKAYSRKKGPWG